MERCDSSEITRSKSVGEKRLWYLLLKSSDWTVVTTISALAPVVAVLLVDDGLKSAESSPVSAFFAWSSSSSRSTRKSTRRALPVRRKSLMTAAATSVLPVPVAISKR